MSAAEAARRSATSCGPRVGSSWAGHGAIVRKPGVGDNRWTRDPLVALLALGGLAKVTPLSDQIPRPAFRDLDRGESERLGEKHSCPLRRDRDGGDLERSHADLAELVVGEVSYDGGQMRLDP